MDRRVVDVLQHLPERMRFIRGLRSFVGFRQVGLPYERAAREAGSSKYSLRALIGLAIDGLVSFSSYPLRLVTRLGLATISFVERVAPSRALLEAEGIPCEGVGEGVFIEVDASLLLVEWKNPPRDDELAPDVPESEPPSEGR